MYNNKPRYLLLDNIRGLAVLTMIHFHLSYDLRIFGFNSIDFQNDPFWFGYPRFIVFLFLISVGIGQTLTHRKGIKWNKAKKRFFKIFSFALIISLLTYLQFPKRWVYFGTLHCIAATSLASLYFVNKPKLSLGLGIFCLILNIFLPKEIIPISKWLNVISMDYIPFYPWIGVVLIGIYLAHKDIHKYSLPTNIVTRGLAYLGKHALIIYLIHQPLLYGICLGAKRILG